MTHPRSLGRRLHEGSSQLAVIIHRSPGSSPSIFLSFRACREGELLREDNAEVWQKGCLHRDRRRRGRGAGSQKGTSSMQPSGASPSSVEPVSLPDSLVAGPLPLRNRRSILSHFLLQIPTPCLWLPPLVALHCFWDNCSGAQRPSIRAGWWGGWCTCVFYLILTDHMFQEPFPVNKDSIKLMKKKILLL